jgi:hypothetical protein
MKTFLLFIILALSQIAFAQDIIDLPRQSKDTVDIDTIIHHH